MQKPRNWFTIARPFIDEMKPMFARMKLWSALTALLLGGCGYKGDLYLPKADDDNRFGVIQTAPLPLQPDPENQP